MNGRRTESVRGRFAAALAAAVWAATTALGAQTLDVSGTWQPKYWTIKIALQQDGNRVWGYGGARDFWFRGHWNGKQLLLVASNFAEKRKGACTPRGVFALSGTTVTSLTSTWVQADGRMLRGPWLRLSPDTGDRGAYPYATELTYCGSLRAYELVFPSGSDVLEGTNWPILEAVAGVLESNGGMKIQVGGHTDSTGDPAKNQALSERRAAAVKKALVDRYGADEARIAAAGYGANQPIAENKTDDGRALNRRVEITLAR